VQGDHHGYEELFDISNDPKEQKNLAGSAAHASVLEANRIRCQELVFELAR
jgi:hypothetical protein